MSRSTPSLGWILGKLALSSPHFPLLSREFGHDGVSALDDRRGTPHLQSDFTAASKPRDLLLKPRSYLHLYIQMDKQNKPTSF